MSATLSTVSDTTSDVGTYAITGTASAPNYDITFVNGTWEVTPAPIVLTFADADRIYGAANPSDYSLSVLSGALYNGTRSATSRPRSRRLQP